MNRRCRGGVAVVVVVVVVGEKEREREYSKVLLVPGEWMEKICAVNIYWGDIYIFLSQPAGLNCLMLMMLAGRAVWELTCPSICHSAWNTTEAKKKKKKNQFVSVFLIRFLTSAKGVVVPWWQCELGLGVANVQLQSGLVWGWTFFFFFSFFKN